MHRGNRVVALAFGIGACALVNTAERVSLTARAKCMIGRSTKADIIFVSATILLVFFGADCQEARTTMFFHKILNRVVFLDVEKVFLQRRY